MKKLRSLQGGYPRQQDYLLTIQDELHTLANSLFSKLGHDMILRGCEVTNHGNGSISMAPGIAFVGNEVLRFDGANNIVSDGTRAFVKSAPANTDPKVFADGQSREVYSEVKAVIGNYSSVSEIKVLPSLYTLATYIEEITGSYALKGEIKDIYDLDGDFLTNFDSSGLGITPRYNDWALFNGNNGGPDGEGRVRITSGTVTHPVNGQQTTFNHGEAGGEVSHFLTVLELPEHDHQYSQPQATNNIDNGNSNRFGHTPNHNARTGKTGGNQAHNNLQPFVAVYTIIKIR